MGYAGGPDRRRYPRWRARDGVECQLQTRTRVRLIDISADGALLGSELPLPAGTQARLRSAIGTAPFSPAVEIRRVAPRGADPTPIALGAIFLSMDDRSRRSLELFLKMAGS